MSTDNFDQDDILGFTAEAAVTKNLGVKLAAGRQVQLCATSGERAIGISLDTVTAAGDDVAVLPGFAFKRITSGAAFSDLDPLAVDTAGKFRTATAGQVVVAVAMEAASGADVNVQALILPMGQYRVPAAAIAALTGAGGGSANGSLVDEGTISTAGGNTYADAAVNTVLGKIKDNIAELAAKQELIRAALVAQGITL